jgi:hypothetical protein
MGHLQARQVRAGARGGDGPVNRVGMDRGGEARTPGRPIQLRRRRGDRRMTREEIAPSSSSSRGSWRSCRTPIRGPSSRPRGVKVSITCRRTVDCTSRQDPARVLTIVSEGELGSRGATPGLLKAGAEARRPPVAACDALWGHRDERRRRRSSLTQTPARYRSAQAGGRSISCAPPSTATLCGRPGSRCARRIRCATNAVLPKGIRRRNGRAEVQWHSDYVGALPGGPYTATDSRPGSGAVVAHLL